MYSAGEQTVVLVSDHNGRTWPQFGRVFDGRESGLIHWEVSVAPLHDGRILAVAWVHDPRTGQNHSNRFALSCDDGASWGPAGETGLSGQTCKVLELQDGRLPCIYRRMDRPGLWANLATLEDDRWLNIAEAPVWQGPDLTPVSTTNSADALAALRFGYPSPLQLPDGQVLVAFWCVENCQTLIRLTRLRVAPAG